MSLKRSLRKKGNTDMLNLVQDISNMVNIHYIRQKEPKGLGHAIYCAKSFIGDEPFAVLLGDDIVDAQVPCLKQMIDVFNEYKTTVVGVQHVADDDVSKYGIVSCKPVDDRVYKVKDMVEKPDRESAPSNIAILGRYIITPKIFEFLENAEPGKGGEIQLTDALKRLMGCEAMYAYDFIGKRYDVGSKMGFLQATLEFALKREDIQEDIVQYLKDIVCKI